MVHVELQVPGATSQAMELVLDESMTVSQIIVDACNLVHLRDSIEVAQDASDFLLCEVGGGRVLLGDRTLAECKVPNGARLMLV